MWKKQMKIVEIIFTSFIINKICLLSSLKTNDLAHHININTTMKHKFNSNWSFPNSNTHHFSILTIYLLFLTGQHKQNLETFKQYSFRNWGAPNRNVLAFFKDKLNSSQHFEIQTRWFQASAKEMRSVLLWYVREGIVAIPYRRIRTTYLSHLQGARILQHGTNRLFQKTVKLLTFYAA